jgi:hypothetical protein
MNVGAIFVAVLMAALSSASSLAQRQDQSLRPGSKLENGPMSKPRQEFPAPSSIKMIDMFTKEVSLKPADSMPEKRRFLFKRNGVEVQRREDADEVIPILEVRMFPLNKDGKLVPKEKAVRLRIEEFGPRNAKLRWTIMVAPSE